MNKRYIAAAVMITVGLLAMIGAVGSLEYGSIGVGETFIRAGAGLALVFAAVPVSGDIKRNRP